VLIPVSPDEWTLDRPLRFDLYEGSGTLLAPAGQTLPLAERTRLRGQTVYRDHRTLPFQHEGLEFPDADTPLTEAEKAAGQAEQAAAPIYSPETNRLVFGAIQHFWDQMQAGAPPDVALCQLVRDQLVAEVTSKADQIHALTQLAVRDGFTYSHTLHVAALSIALAIEAGYDAEAVREIGLAAILHDLGKFLIPKPIMFKPSRLTAQEFEVMKLHPGLGYKIITEELKLPRHLALPALEHQEMYGGGGYPQNLKGDEIHPYSQIVKVADVYEALTARRPYKDPIPSTKALAIMQAEGPKNFNPTLLATFSQMAHSPVAG
jgi:hypothetical protein